MTHSIFFFFMAVDKAKEQSITLLIICFLLRVLISIKGVESYVEYLLSRLRDTMLNIYLAYSAGKLVFKVIKILFMNTKGEC